MIADPFDEPDRRLALRLVRAPLGRQVELVGPCPYHPFLEQHRHARHRKVHLRRDERRDVPIAVHDHAELAGAKRISGAGDALGRVVVFLVQILGELRHFSSLGGVECGLSAGIEEVPPVLPEEHLERPGDPALQPPHPELVALGESFRFG